MQIGTEDCPLLRTVRDFPTDFWNDSCSVEELTYAIARGAVGATSNPTIVLNVLQKEMHLWRDRILQIAEDNPTWSDEQVSWQLFEELAVRGAQIIQPVFERENGLKGRLSIQTNPAMYRNAQALAEQAVCYSKLAPNMQVKIAVTRAGVAAIEEAAYRGVNINATVCFTVPQALAVGAAIERGMCRREAEGLPTADMRHVCTLMVGRLDDWMRVVAGRDHIVATPGYLDWAGIACLKKAYPIYQARGYRTRLLAAAYRNHLHWSEFIGGDVVLTIPYEWQRLFNASDVPVVPRFENPVPAAALDELYTHFADFRRAYDEDGMTVDEFDTYGPTVRTLRAFIASFHDLVTVVRDIMLPNPDK